MWIPSRTRPPRAQVSGAALGDAAPTRTGRTQIRRSPSFESTASVACPRPRAAASWRSGVLNAVARRRFSRLPCRPARPMAGLCPRRLPRSRRPMRRSRSAESDEAGIAPRRSSHRRHHPGSRACANPSLSICAATGGRVVGDLFIEGPADRLMTQSRPWRRGCDPLRVPGFRARSVERSVDRRARQPRSWRGYHYHTGDS